MPTYFGNQQYFDIRLGTQQLNNIIQPPPYVVLGSTLILNGGASYPGTGNTWFDLSGYSNNAALTNMADRYISSNGGYFDFPNDGSRFMQVAQQTNLNNTFASDFTIDIWMTIDALATSFNDFVCPVAKSGIGVNPGFGILINRDSVNATSRGQVRFYANGSDLGAFSTKLTITLGGWFNLQLVRSGTTLTAYNNVVSLGTKTTSANMSSTDPFSIGKNLGGTDYQMQGDIGWVALYNRALSTAELTQNFNANRIKFNV